MRWFSVLAMVVVASLVFGTLGVAVFSDLFSDDKERTITVDPNEVDPIEQGFLDEIEEDPNDFASMAALGEYYNNAGQYDQATRMYERALMIVPDDMAIRFSFANSLAAAAKQNDAELQYQKVIAAEPGNFTAILRLARLYRNWSPPRIDDAAVLYRQVIDGRGDSLLVDLAMEELAEMTGTPVALLQASPVSSLMASPEP